jgi:hypothetical protein
MSRLRQLLDSFRALPRWAKIAAEAVTAISALAALIFLLFPTWKPQDCRGETRGEFIKIDLDRSVTREASLELQGASKDGVPPERLREPGKLVTYTLIARNLKGKTLTLRTWVLSDGGEPVSDPALRNQLAATITPTDCVDEVVDRIWSPIPRDPGDYKILLDLKRDDGLIVASRATKIFPA